MDGCIYRSQFDLCEKSKEEDEKRGIRRWCDFERCEDKHPSNADRIRAMTDEKLADFLAEQQLDLVETIYGLFKMPVPDYLAGVKDDALDWLRQEAEHGCAD